MRIAVVTTTINVPHVLALYHRYADHKVTFFIAGDLKTPAAVQDFCDDYSQMVYLPPGYQKKWKSSEIIGWNTDSRRNFAVLEALQCGADLIISIDDDMIPYPSFFTCFEKLFEGKWSGIQLGSPHVWLNHGQYTYPSHVVRGMPTVFPTSHDNAVEQVNDIIIGAAQGIIIGVPDNDARFDKFTITGTSDILRYGFVTHPQSYSVFNSQVTAFRRELAPGFAQFYGEQGRNTDIFASLFMRSLMRDLGWYTHYGLPMAYHNRTARNLSKDFDAEKWGMDNVQTFADELAGGGWHYSSSKVLSERCKDMYALWLQDCREAMK